MKYKITTLGCKVNQFETQAIEVLLQKRGFFPAQKDEDAEIVIINTCAVTDESGRKSRKIIRKLKLSNPNAIIAVCGCFSQLSPDEISEIGAEVIHGSGEKERFIEDIIGALSTKRGIIWTDDPFMRKTFEELSPGAASGRTRAMLKIQDGCVNFCTYCIIPYTRGRVRSLPLERCAAQTEILASEGFREIVITGIEIASYGQDLSPKASLTDAIEAIAEKASGIRIRLGSLEPTVITEDFCKRLSKTGKVCNHFHLSLQSGSDNVLNRMNRKYDTSVFFEKTELLREYYPNCALTADLIVGFPGESNEEFEETLSFIKKCSFSAMHIFPYSSRPGTKASEMEGHISSKVKEERAAKASEVSAEMQKNFLDSCVSQTFEVLFETENDEMSVGHASNYTQVCVGGERLHGLVENVEIFGISNKMLVGKLVDFIDVKSL